MSYASFLTTDEVHEDEVELAGQAHKVWFRAVPHSVYARFVRESSSDDVDQRDAAAARFVAASLCNPDGTLAFTGEEACRLKASVVNALVPLIVKISRAVDPGKASPPGEASGSGTS